MTASTDKAVWGIPLIRRTGTFSVGSGHPPIRRKPFVGASGRFFWLDFTGVGASDSSTPQR